MKAKLIATFLAASTFAVAHAQISAAPSSGSGTSSSRTRLNTQPSQYPAGVRGESIARYGASYGMVVRRGNTTPPGSIVLNAPLPPKEMDELVEDLSVLSFIFNRNLERAFGEKATEFKLGVPITMGERRAVDTTYIQGFGILVKVTVPFAVAPSPDDNNEKPSAHVDTEWEKAKRALYGADNAEGGGEAGGLNALAKYDPALVAELKRQMFDALKNAANLRHLDEKESLVIAVTGDIGGLGTIDPLTGMAVASGNPVVSVLTIRVRKAECESAEKTASIANYFAPGPSARGGGAAMGGYGLGYGYPITGK